MQGVRWLCLTVYVYVGMRTTVNMFLLINYLSDKWCKSARTQQTDGDGWFPAGRTDHRQTDRQPSGAAPCLLCLCACMHWSSALINPLNSQHRLFHFHSRRDYSIQQTTDRINNTQWRHNSRTNKLNPGAARPGGAAQATNCWASPKFLRLDVMTKGNTEVYMARVRCFIHRLISPMHQTWALWRNSDASVKSTGE